LHAENQGFAALPPPPSLGDVDFVRRVIEAVPNRQLLVTINCLSYLKKGWQLKEIL